MVQAVQSRMAQFSDLLATVERAEEDCLSANVDENDYTVFTHEDLQFELDQLTQAISKKLAFIDNQARSLFHPSSFSLNSRSRLYPGT